MFSAFLSTSIGPTLANRASLRFPCARKNSRSFMALKDLGKLPKLGGKTVSASINFTPINLNLRV